MTTPAAIAKKPLLQRSTHAAFPTRQLATAAASQVTGGTIAFAVTDVRP